MHLPCAFSDGPQGHWLFDLSKRYHHSQTRERQKAWIPRVIVCEIIVRVLAVQFTLMG